ncbi:MAG: TM2 domain-containing protein [Candidatus Omnitrophica bacterium]|nr:TM2 domain-containing protein [Candidatus Omnitrophota bacterium]
MKGTSKKSRLVALLLCLFLGWLGAHRFYVGKVGTGILMVVAFFGVFGIWALVDLIFIACGIFRDKEGKRMLQWFEQGSI